MTQCEKLHCVPAFDKLLFDILSSIIRHIVQWFCNSNNNSNSNHSSIRSIKNPRGLGLWICFTCIEPTGEEVEKKVAKEVERQVAAHFDVAMEKLKVGECLDMSHPPKTCWTFLKHLFEKFIWKVSEQFLKRFSFEYWWAKGCYVWLLCRWFAKKLYIPLPSQFGICNKWTRSEPVSFGFTRAHVTLALTLMRESYTLV